jgi:hypothetical protein
MTPMSNRPRIERMSLPLVLASLICLLAIPLTASTVLAQEPTGACCSSVYTCSTASQAECEQSGGIYQGDGTVCEPNPCVPAGWGACCYVADGVCQVGPSTACSGEYLGDGTICTPYPCHPMPTGACCAIQGEQGFVCVDGLSAISCSAAVGTYMGDGTRCGAVLCGPDWGSCCRPDGTCFICDAHGCEIESGQFQGAGALCDPDPCHATPTQDTSWGQIRGLYR